MSLLIDTSAIVSARNADDKNHNKALEIMIRALKGEFGKLYKNFVNDIGIFARTKPMYSQPLNL